MACVIGAYYTRVNVRYLKKGFPLPCGIYLSDFYP